MNARILIGSRSRSFGRGLADCLERDGDLTVIGILADVAGLVHGAECEKPDLVVLELDLPDSGGEEATRLIMRHGHTRVVVIVAHDQRHSERADAVLLAGAVGVVPRSAVTLDAPDSVTADALRRRLRRLATARLGPASIPAPATPGLAAAVPPRPAWGARHADVVGICTSTGGPRALETVLRHLPADFEVPVLIVQHMGPGFIEGLARWLDGEIPLAVRVASADEPLGPGVRLAPDGAHLVLGPTHRLELDRITVASSHRPSGDVLLASLARRVGAGAVAVVMTGMGRDGAAGLADVAAAGGQTIAQDEASSTIYGMPRAAAELGAQTVLPLDDIGPRLASLSRLRRER